MVLNEIPPFDILLPTVENMGEQFYIEINKLLLKNGFELYKLEISEIPRNNFV